MIACALFEPDIPQNAGTILRLGACLGVPVHIIHPAGFVLSDRNFKRAGLDYLSRADFSEHTDWSAFEAWRSKGGHRLVVLSAKGSERLDRYSFQADDVLLFGREPAGLPNEVVDSADAYRYKAPPLFNWMLATLGLIIPVDGFSIGLLRYALLGTLYGFIYLAARRLLGDPRLSALSVFSFAALNPFGEASHRNITHSTTLTAATAVAWYVFLRIAAAPHVGWYLALGATFGLGMLAKWNFVILVLALPLACLASREHRRLVLTWKIVPAALVACAIVLPTVIATLKLQPPAEDQVGTILNLESGPGIIAAIHGTLNLLDAAVIYSLPLLPIVLILFGGQLLRGIRGVISGNSPSDIRANTVLIGVMIAIGLAILWILVLVGGATVFKVRYLYPVLLILPVFLFMIIEAGHPSDWSLKLFALVLAALAVFVAGKRVAQIAGVVDCGLCMEWRPYGAIAAQLTDAGYSGDGTILTDIETGGNMRVQFPRARILDPAYPRTNSPAPSDEGQCLILSFDDSDPKTREIVRGQFETFLAEALRGRPGMPHRDGALNAQMSPPAEGVLRLSYRLYDGPNGDCR